MVRARLRRKYSGPSHLWQMDRIKEEAALMKKYGCANKKELWKMKSILREFRSEARRLIPFANDQAMLERKQLLNKLISLGMIEPGADLEDVLGLDVGSIMSRRLQTLVLEKGLANTVKQSRQFITHGHISLKNTKVTSPSMLIKKGDEGMIGYFGSSPVSNEMHPERMAGSEKRKREATKTNKVESKKPKEKVEAPTGLEAHEEKEILESES